MALRDSLRSVTHSTVLYTVVDSIIEAELDK